MFDFLPVRERERGDRISEALKTGDWRLEMEKKKSRLQVSGEERAERKEAEIERERARRSRGSSWRFIRGGGGNARRKSHARATRLCHVTTEEPGKDGLQCLERFPGNCRESVQNWKFS
ncbi:hypothetical protein AAC387_Pa02g4736 [Persea americana]